MIFTGRTYYMLRDGGFIEGTVLEAHRSPILGNSYTVKVSDDSATHAGEEIAYVPEADICEDGFDVEKLALSTIKIYEHRICGLEDFLSRLNAEAENEQELNRSIALERDRLPEEVSV